MLKRLSLSFVVLFLMLLPTWFFLLLRFVLHPVGFWQNLVMTGVGFWALGGMQLITFMIGCVVLFAVWD